MLKINYVIIQDKKKLLFHKKTATITLKSLSLFSNLSSTNKANFTNTLLTRNLPFNYSNLLPRKNEFRCKLKYLVCVCCLSTSNLSLEIVDRRALPMMDMISMKTLSSRKKQLLSLFMIPSQTSKKLLYRIRTM